MLLPLDPCRVGVRVSAVIELAFDTFVLAVAAILAVLCDVSIADTVL